MLNRGEGHINNLYNTTFWALVQKGGMDARQAEEKLKVRITGTDGGSPAEDRIAGDIGV